LPFFIEALRESICRLFQLVETACIAWTVDLFYTQRKEQQVLFSCHISLTVARTDFWVLRINLIIPEFSENPECVQSKSYVQSHSKNAFAAFDKFYKLQESLGVPMRVWLCSVVYIYSYLL
jgi:hypothetical protein